MWEIDYEQGLELLKAGQLEEAEARLAAAASQVDLEDAGPELFGQVHFYLAQARRAQHQWSEALEALTRALHPLRKAYSSHDPRLAVLLNQLGQLIAYTGKAGDAEPAFMECLNTVRRMGDVRILAGYLCVLGDFYLFHRAPLRAAGYLQEACALLTRAFGPADTQGCHIQLALADVWDRIDKSQQAEELRAALQQAVRPDLVLEVVFRRATAFKRKRDWTRQLEVLQQGLLVAVADERRLAQFQGEIGNALLGLTRFAEAEAALTQAYQLWMNALGPEHPQVAVAASDLARLWQSQARLQEAEQGYQFGHSVFHQQLGESHPLTLSLCDRLIECSLQRKDYTRAQLLTIETMKVRSAAYGDSHPLVAESLSLLGRIWLDQRQFKQAADVLAQSLTIYSQYPVSGDFPALLARYALGAALQGVYKYYDAEEHYRAVLQELEQYYGETHFLVPLILRNLGWLLRQTGRDRAATESMARAEKLSKRV